MAASGPERLDRLVRPDAGLAFAYVTNASRSSLDSDPRPLRFTAALQNWADTTKVTPRP